MSDFTLRANLRLPGGGSAGTILPDEQVDIDVLNDNFRKIDALLGARNIPSASSYSGSMDGDLVYARDTEFLHMFSANAGGLITPRLPGARQYSGTAAERVAFAPQAKDGDLWRDPDNLGVIWAYKAGSPGTWEYTGNPLRGTRAAMDQLVTDGRAVVGMKCYNTDDNNDYVVVASTATPPVLSWRRKEETVVFKAAASFGAGGGVSGVLFYSGVQTINFPNPRAGVVPVVSVMMISDSGGISWVSVPNSGVTDTYVYVRAVRAGAAPTVAGAFFHVTLRYE